MVQLIKIHHTPIKYQFHIEKARLELTPADAPQVKLDKTPMQTRLHTRNIQVQLDTTEMRKSMGLKNTSVMLYEQAQRGQQLADSATARMASEGTELSHIEQGVSITELLARKLFEQPSSITTFMPSVGPEIDWIPNEIQTEFTPDQVHTDWEINKNVLSYIPGKFELIIEQYPSVNIEYLGSPVYVPASADPNYQGQPA